MLASRDGNSSIPASADLQIVLDVRGERAHAAAPGHSRTTAASASRSTLAWIEVTSRPRSRSTWPSSVRLPPARSISVAAVCRRRCALTDGSPRWQARRTICETAPGDRPARGARRRSDFPHRDASLDGGHLVIDGEERVRCGNAGPKAAGRRGYASPHDCGCRIAVAAGIPDRTSSESALLVAAGQRSPLALEAAALLQRTAVRSSGPNSPGAGEPVPGAR